jgi:asparagine synthase (glutamine-hydrolysing)
VEDEQSGDWLLSVGSWFHTSGLGPGEEQKLLELFQERGAVPLASELEGFFTLVVGNIEQKQLLVITDVVGSCHAFWRQFPGFVVLSGSSLLLAALKPCHVDPIACQEFVHTGIIYEDRTLFTEVRKLAPATVFWFCDGRLKRHHQYWDPCSLKPESLCGQAAVDALYDSVTASIKAITRVFPNPVCDLTGGYDSRAVIAGFLSARAGFTATVSGPAGSGDVTISKALAQMLHVPHLHFPPRSATTFAEARESLFFTDGEFDLIDYASILGTHRAQSRNFQISINGSFGELARGYYWELLVPRTGKRELLDAVKLASARYASGRILPGLFRPNERIEMVPHFTQMIKRNNTGLENTPNTFQMDMSYLGLRMQRWQGRIASSTNRIWPCVSPFIFRSTLEVILQTDNALRRRSLMIRRMFHSRQRALAEFPLEHGYPAAPVRLGNLHCFLPLASYYGAKLLRWIGMGYEQVELPDRMQTRLKLWEEPEVIAMLQPDTMRLAVLLDPAALKSLLRRSKETNFSEDSEWRRLVTLECTLGSCARLSPDW